MRVATALARVAAVGYTNVMLATCVMIGPLIANNNMGNMNIGVLTPVLPDLLNTHVNIIWSVWY